MTNTSPPAISHHLNAWLSIKKESKSLHTFNASKYAAKAFLKAVGNLPLPTLTEDHFSVFLRSLRRYNARTEQLYATLIFGWFEYLDAKQIKTFNISKLKYVRRSEQRHPGKRLREFDRPSLEQLKQSIMDFAVGPDDLILARAKAMVVLALDSGLRVSELCKLRVGDLDIEHLSGIVIGKRNKQRRFPFTKKSVRVIQAYLGMRKRLESDRGNGLMPSDVPVFVSHSKRGHRKLEPLDTDAARMDLAKMVTILVGKPKKPITPHVLRHFAGNELRKAVGDMEIVRILLGHESMETTKGYMHVEDEEALAAYQKKFGVE